MMSHLKVRLIVALVAAATMTSASSAQAADTKKKQQFADLLSASVSTATTSSPGAYVLNSATTASRASSGIHAATVRPAGTTFSQYRALVLSNFFLNRNLLLGKLAVLRREYATGLINRSQFLASRRSDLTLFYAQRTGLLSEYRTGTPYVVTSPGGVLPVGPLTVIR